MVEYDPQEKELVKTLDRKLLPFLAALYLCILIDRTGQLHTLITNPNTKAGLEHDISLTDDSYMWGLAAFAIGSLATTLPLALIFRKIGPGVWFGVFSIIWGLMAAVSAGATNSAGFISTRFFLGATQGGFVPCIILYIVYFYTKEEYAVRFASIISVATALQAMCGFISHHVARADGYMGLAGWQFVFLLDGLFGIIMGVITCFYLPNYPETCYFLNQADRVLAVARGKDGVDLETSLISGLRKVTKTPVYKFEMVQLLDALKDIQTWILSLAYLFITITLDCLLILAPEVTATSFLLDGKEKVVGLIADYEDATIPITFLASVPYLFAVVVSILLAKQCEERNKRPWPATVCLLISSGGFLFMTLVSPIYVGGGPSRFFLGLLPAVIGIMCATPLVLAYAMDRAADDTYRAAVAAIIIAPGHAFGLLVAGNPLMFQEANAPTYPGANLLCSILMLCAGN